MKKDHPKNIQSVDAFQIFGTLRSCWRSSAASTRTLFTVTCVSLFAACAPRASQIPNAQSRASALTPSETIHFSDFESEDKGPKTPAVPAGFLFPVGGGASSGNNGALKPAQVEIHRAALNQMQDAHLNGSLAGTNVCIVEYHTDNPDTASSIALVEKLFIAAGKPNDEVNGYVFDTTEKANDQKVASEISKSCGLVFFPGGDQTQMRDLWKGTALKKAFEDIFGRGGGIMGKSAGAALQGSIGYFPAAASDPSAGALAINASVSRSEFGNGFFNINLEGMSPFYIETHAGDRERAARALSLLASWEDRQKTPHTTSQHAVSAKSNNKNQSAMGIVVDSDTGVLIRFDAVSQSWVGEVYGARIAEFLSSTAKSKSGLDSRNQPFATNYSTHALLSGGKIVLSGQFRGTVFAHNAVAGRAVSSLGCLKNLPSSIDGKYDEDSAKASQVTFDARDPASGNPGGFNTVEYAYLGGDLIVNKMSGCGYWQSNALNADYGRPENRLNAQRFALGAGLASFSVSLPPSMEVQVGAKGATLKFNPRNQDGSASLLYDISHASQRSVGTYIYKELGYSKPVQVGAWENGTVHLIPAQSRFDLSTMTVMQLGE